MAAVLPKPAAAPPAIEEPEPYTAEQFTALANQYPDLRMELTAQGEIIIMPPTSGGTGRRNFKIIGQLAAWTERDGTGVGFDSSTGFALPNGAKRSPDAAWLEKSRWESLPPEVREDEYVPLCPDFVIELRSRTDRLSTVQRKMLEYIANGARLGWLLDPKNRRVEIYRPDREIAVLEQPSTLSGEDVLPGFVLDLTPIWDIDGPANERS